LTRVRCFINSTIAPMDYIFISFSLISFARGASSGASFCDALGLCTIPSSGAYNDTETGEMKCPWGMHLVGAPTRSNDYIVSTADIGDEGPTSYQPGELLDIHIRVLNPMKKFLGILIYAVQNDGILGAEGCPAPGCDGKEEIKVGTWEETDNIFQASCNGKAMTHKEASVKNYHHVLRWRAPEAGSGDVIFRVIVKQGSTNGGFFYWPMVEGDLMLFEGPMSTEYAGEKWVAGPIDQTCPEICASKSRSCDRSVILNGTLDLYDEVKSSLSCQRPLLSKCSKSAPTRDSNNHCWFENYDDAECKDLNTEPISICDDTSTDSPGSQRLCPCGGFQVNSSDTATGTESSSKKKMGDIALGVSALATIIGVFASIFRHSGDGSQFDQQTGGKGEVSQVAFDEEIQEPGIPSAPPAQVEGMVSPTSQYMDNVWAGKF